MSKLTPPYFVQIAVDLHHDYFREVALGARHYGYESGRLRFADRWLEHELAEGLDNLTAKRGIQGLIMPVHTLEIYERVVQLTVPVVNVSTRLSLPDLPLVKRDDVGVGRLAAEHLLARGCRVFGFWGMERRPFSEERLTGFSGKLAEQNLTPSVARAQGSTEQRIQKLTKWLSDLPRPCGVFAVDDFNALTVIRIVHELGYKVPEDFAVVGAGNESYWGNFERIPLSSVRLPAYDVGYQAAILLDEMLSGKTTTVVTRTLPVTEVIGRKSTDIIFTEDDAIRNAIIYIRSHAHKNPYVADVARAAKVSSQVLQRRFRRVLGRSVLDEILRVRIDHAQSLLTRTRLTIGEIADRCGFPNPQRFSLRFKQSTGLSPVNYRKGMQLYTD
ncbi:MAG: substrate-binding domain-containing protein, partial [Verrucomicrobiota bacterium JB024]|nr:substrate-binding domain-containing protein [Verrucomicrobiota bacterium JB024]